MDIETKRVYVLLIYYIGIYCHTGCGWALLSYTIEHGWGDACAMWLSTREGVDNACVDMVCVYSDLISGSRETNHLW